MGVTEQKEKGLTLETYLPLAGVAERLVCYTDTRIAARPRVDLS